MSKTQDSKLTPPDVVRRSLLNPLKSARNRFLAAQLPCFGKRDAFQHPLTGLAACDSATNIINDETTDGARAARGLVFGIWRNASVLS